MALPGLTEEQNKQLDKLLKHLLEGALMTEDFCQAAIECFEQGDRAGLEGYVSLITEMWTDPPTPTSSLTLVKTKKEEMN